VRPTRPASTTLSMTSSRTTRSRNNSVPATARRSFVLLVVLPLIAITVRIALLTTPTLSSPVVDDDIIDHPRLEEGRPLVDNDRVDDEYEKDDYENGDDDASSGDDDDDHDDAPPPEPLDAIAFCAEKCRYVPAMCTSNLYLETLSHPAPTCMNRSTSIEDDAYWTDTEHGRVPGTLTPKRNRDTSRLVHWAARRARERRRGRGEGRGPTTTTNATTTTAEEEGAAVRCEDVPTSYESPMMFPEEFEFVVKLLANLKPDTYLEWGTGMSTSFYPLLASGTVIAIDGYPPWCRRVGSEPRVRCMAEREGRLIFHCPELAGADGHTRLDLRAVGKLPPNVSDADVVSAMGMYVDSVVRAAHDAGVDKFDAALVDGRFRMQCALRLLPYLRDDSVLIMHDFWVRLKAYEVVLDYYYVIGYARSVVALKKKRSILSREEELIVYERYMTRDHLTWTDLA